MAILSTLLSVAEPSGMWISIIKAFEAVTNNYVLAIIFLTVVIRLIWGIIETFSKYSQQNMNSMQAKMQPELEKLKVKYANQPQVLQQKQNELYKRNFGKGYYGSCIIMLIVMVLNLLIFFTLLSGLNSMASFKISENYDNLKYTYANCLNVTDIYFDGNYNDSSKYEVFKDYENLEFRISTNEGEKIISLVYTGGESEVVLATSEYKTDFSQNLTQDGNLSTGEGQTESGQDGENGEGETDTITSNEYIISIINKIFPVYNEGVPSFEEIVIDNITLVDENGQPILDEGGQPVTEPLYLSTAIQNVAMKEVVIEYDKHKDSFLWIENIWFADSPLQDSIISYNSLVSQVGSKNIEEGEEQIYNAFMPDLKETRNRVNGYYILPILCVIVSFFSVYITTLYNKIKSKKKGIEPVKQQNGKIMMVVIPILLGIFALFYNSVFAIYMLVGQLVSLILSPLQLMIIDKIIDNKSKKEENKVIVDYSRKF